MNREIKFRAWCEGKHDNITFHKPKMEYGIELSKDGYYLAVLGKWDIQGEYKSIPIMQYTGLKDKNGKEIYEGDIIRVNGRKRVGFYNTEVVQSNQGWTIKSNKTYYNDDAVLCLKNNLEVIGNIHENKKENKKENNG